MRRGGGSDIDVGRNTFIGDGIDIKACGSTYVGDRYVDAERRGGRLG